MKYSIVIGGFLLLSGISTASLAAPPAFQASYSVAAKGINVGTMTSSLSYTASGYTYQKSSQANGLAAVFSGDTLSERSSGTKNGNALSSTSYSQQHKNKRKNRKDEFQFSGATHVQGSYDGKAYSLSVPANAIDPALMELRIMEDLATGKPMNYQVVQKGKLRPYQLRSAGTENLTLPYGKVSAEKVQIMHSDGARQTTLWLIPELNYAIGKVRHNEEGDVIEMQLTDYKAR